MAEKLLQHIQLEGISDYIAALDTLCGLAERNLYLFDNNFEGLGFNSEARYSTLHRFLLGSPTHRLYVLAHDIRYLANSCPRMMMLLRQFSGRMFIHRTITHLHHITTPFAVADDVHCLRRFHFNDTRGVFEQNDAAQARVLKSYFMEMWGESPQALSADKLGL